MNFTGLGPILGTTLLLAGLAAVTALHVLRSRPTEKQVPSLLFWAASAAVARPRQLWQRWRQLLSWLLFALIALALIGATTSWVLQAGPSEPHVIVLDAGATMHAPAADASGPVFDRARAAVLDLLRAGSETQPPQIVVADPTPRLLADATTPGPETRHHLRALRATSLPADLAAAMRYAETLLEDPGGRVTLVTNQLQREGSPARHASVHRLLIPTQRGNAQLASAWFAPLTDDSPRGRGVVVLAAEATGPIDVAVTMTHPALGVVLNRNVTVAPDGWQLLETDPLPADGSALSVVLTEPGGNPVDNTLTLRTTAKPPVHIVAEDTLPAALRFALAASGARFEPANDSAEKLVAAVAQDQEAPTGADLVVVPTTEDSPRAPLETLPHALTADLAFDGVFCRPAPAMQARWEPGRDIALLQAGETVVAFLRPRDAERPQLFLSANLFAPRDDPAQHPALAVLIGRAMQRLSGWSAPSAAIGGARRVQDPVWSATLATARTLTEIPGAGLNGSATAASTRNEETQRALTGGWPYWRLLLLLALALIALDHVLVVRQQRMRTA